MATIESSDRRKPVVRPLREGCGGGGERPPGMSEGSRLQELPGWEAAEEGDEDPEPEDPFEVPPSHPPVPRNPHLIVPMRNPLPRTHRLTGTPPP